MIDQTHTGIVGKLMPLLVGAVLLVLATVALAVGGLPFQSSSPPQLAGTTLAAQPAPDFELSDQSNTQVRLSDLRGKIVSLSFLYTSCPDVCPLTASKLLAAYARLPQSEQSRIEILAVTVDPEHDNQQRRANFVHAQGLDGVLHFLGGDQSDVSKVWDSYHIGVSLPTPGTESAGISTINHNAVTYLVDADGNERVLMDDRDFTPDELAGNFTALLPPLASVSMSTP